MSDVQWTPVTIRLSQLTPWERNPKRISKSHAARLLDLWERLGQFQTIAIGPSGEVYDGHQRLSVLKAAHGGKYEVQALQSSRALTEKEREELTVAAHVGTTGQFDWDALSGWDAGDLQQWGFDAELLAGWQTDIGALRTMLDAEQAPQGDDPGAQIDKAAELQAKWQTATGQLWALGEHRLICGDCTDAAVVERVMGGEKAQVLWTDPPYHVGKVFEGGYDEGTVWDTDFQRSWLECALQFLTPEAQRYVCFAQAQSTHAILEYNPNRLLVWCKPFALMRANEWDWAYEFIAWSYDTPKPTYFQKPNGTASFDWQEIASVIHGQEGRWHITQKPTALPSLHIEASCQVGQIVLDPFLGSGTTLIACERLGRRCRAVEIEPGYVAVALERWATMTGQVPVLLADTGNGT
jgi:DNA modification methylase